MNQPVEGVTTLSNLAPKPTKSLKPKQLEKVWEAIDTAKEKNLKTLEMWTGKYMPGVADDDLHLYDHEAEKAGTDPNHKRKKYLVPVMFDVPFESHFNNEGDLAHYYEKGWMLREEMPAEAKKYLEIAEARTQYGSAGVGKSLTPEDFKREHGKPEAPKKEAEYTPCGVRTKSGAICKSKPVSGTNRCRHHQETNVEDRNTETDDS